MLVILVIGEIERLLSKRPKEHRHTCRFNRGGGCGGVAWLRQATSRRIAHHWTGIEAGIPSAIYSQLLLLCDTSDLSDNQESRDDTEASETLSWCERLIKSILY